MMTSDTPSRVSSVLIIDDSQADLEWCSMILRNTGRFGKITELQTGKGALQLFADFEASKRRYPDSFPPSLILLDINMPAMDGFEFLEKFSALPPECRGVDGEPVVVLMVTSSSAPRDRQRALESRLVADFMTKPVTETQANHIADRFGTRK